MKHVNFQSIIRNLIILMIIFNLLPPVNAQTTPDGSAPQFLFPDFSIGKVRMKNGNAQTIQLNYNTVSEKMVYKKDDNLFDVLNNQMIDTVFIRESKFVPAGEVYYEVLLVGPVTLFVEHKGKLIPPGAVVGYGGTSQVASSSNLTSVNTSMGYYNLKLPEDYSVKVNEVYWIRKDNKMVSYETERQFLKLFPDRDTDFKQFIKKSRIKFDKISDQVRLAAYCNELFK